MICTASDERLHAVARLQFSCCPLSISRSRGTGLGVDFSSFRTHWTEGHEMVDARYRLRAKFLWRSSWSGLEFVENTAASTFVAVR